jgi:protein-S-isoprenylcysteine O-methyltransferase Ste14
MTRPILVLTLLAIYLAVAFGLRSYLQYRRTGSSGFRGISGPPLSVAWFGGVLFVIALVATVAAPLLAWRGIDPALSSPTVLRDAFGGVAFTAGTLFLLWSQGAMGRSWRIGVDHDEVTGLVTSGPFSWVRNPIFSGMLASGVGLVLLLPTVTSACAYTLLVVAIELQVRFVEEPYLLSVHGDSYRTYARRVGRFLPRIGRHGVGPTTCCTHNGS